MSRIFYRSAIARVSSASVVFLVAWTGSPADPRSPMTYVGSQVCAGCHEAEYESFQSHSKKAHSFQSIERMSKGLTEEEKRVCFECHTTGHGKPGGFRSEVETPHLKNAGCEVCHGPGSVHVKTARPEDIKSDVTSDDCRACHSAERVEAFRFKPLVFSGAH